MRCTPLLPALLLVAVLSAAPAFSQQRFWANSVNGVWDDAGKWSAADAPDTPGESAVFDRFGTYNVSLPDTGPITIDDWRVDRGDVTFQSAGFGQATLDVGGAATLDGEVELRGGPGSLEVNIAGALLVEPSAVASLDGVNLTATFGAVNARSSGPNPTQLLLNNGATAEIGLLGIASAPSGAVRSSIDLFGGSTLTVGSLSIANEVADAIGELNLVGSHLRRAAGGGTTTIGFDAVAESPRGSLVMSGGTAELDNVRINRTGLLRNSGGSLLVGGELRVEGGVYEESGAATRDFSDTPLVSVRNGGRIDLVGSALEIGQGTRLEVFDGTLASSGGLTITSQAADFFVGGNTLSVIAADTTLEPGVRVLIVNPGSSRFEGTFDDLGADIQVINGANVHFEEAYQGRGARGGGRLRFEDESRIVTGSQYTASLEWTETASLTLGLPTPGQGSGTVEPLVTVLGSATLDGTLILEAPDRTPQLGEISALLSALPILGSFDAFDGPALDPGHEWRLLQTATSLTAQVVTPGPTGDFNYDGLVDAADYAVWRDTLGSEGPLQAADANGDLVVDGLDLDAWRAGYGSAATGAAVPEPSALAVAVLSLLGFRTTVPAKGCSVARSVVA